MSSSIVIPSDASENQEKSCPNTQELRTQIARMTEELVGYKTWTDSISQMLWSNLACCAAGVPKREVNIPENSALESMDYRRLCEVLEELAEKLEKEKRYEKHWRWVVDHEGGIEPAVKWVALVVKKNFFVISPEHICLNAS